MRYIYQGHTVDGNGNVIASATISIFLNGTSTAASVYVASAGGSAVNSVTSNSTNGSFSFYVSDVDYDHTQKFKVTMTKNNYTTQTYDDIKIFPADDTEVLLSNVSGKALSDLFDSGYDVPIKPSDIQTKGPELDIRAFGATTALSDCSTAINNAISALPSGGGVIYIPQGWYKIANTITVNKAVVFKGQGHGNQSAIITDDHTFTMFNITSDTVEFHDLSISSSAFSGSAYYAISCPSNNNLYLRNVSINGVYHAINVGGTKWVLDTVRITNIKPTSGICVLVAGAGGSEIRNLYAENAGGSEFGHAIYVVACDSLQIVDSNLQKGVRCLYVAPTSGTVASINVVNTFFDTSTNNVVEFNPTGSGIVRRIRFSSCWFSSSLRGMVIDGDTKGVIIEGSEFLGNSDAGLYVDPSGDAELTVIGNSFAGNGQQAIAILANVNKFNLIGNHCGPYGGFGANDKGIVVNTGTSNNYVIVGNNCIGNTTLNFSDAGTGTSKIVKNNLTGVNSDYSPAFNVHKNGTNQTTIADSTWTKVTWSTERFDTAGNFASDKFTPQVPGQYSLSSSVQYTAGVDNTALLLGLYQNGSLLGYLALTRAAGTGSQGHQGSMVVQANGSTDYFEIYVYQASGGNLDISGAVVSTWFCGSKVG